MSEEAMRKHYEKTPKETLIKILVASRKEVEKLQNRNKERKQEIERLNKARKTDIEYNKYLQKEIIRLNTIINELEKELDRGYLTLFEHELVPGRELITNIKNYLQELKGSSNNEK